MSSPNPSTTSVGWLLDATVFEAYHDDLVAAILRNGHVVKSINSPNPPYRWDDTGSSYRGTFPRGSCVVTHADIDLVNRVLTDNRWTPGAFATADHFFCSHYFTHFGKYLLNSDYTMLPFGELARCSDFLFETFGRDGKIFVRPDSPLKLFAGLIASRNSFARDLEFMGFYEFPIESLVVVSSPKQIESEWRFVVARQQIVAGSLYKRRDQMLAESGYDQAAYDFANSVLSVGYAPDPVWVMDICRTTDGQMALLEIGGFSFANLYGCDKDAVVRATSQVAAEIQLRSTQSLADDAI
jgi:hypothetical protein